MVVGDIMSVYRLHVLPQKKSKIVKREKKVTKLITWSSTPENNCMTIDFFY